MDRLGEIWHVSLSQTYNILTRLEEQGFIRGTIQVQENRPAKRHFRLTAAGRRRFEAWLSSGSACSVRAIRIEFMTRLYFLHARNSADALRSIDTQTAALQDYVDVLKERMEAMDKNQIFNCLGMSLRIRQLESLVESLQECKTKIKS